MREERMTVSGVDDHLGEHLGAGLLDHSYLPRHDITISGNFVPKLS